MIDKNTLNKILKVNDKEIIEDILVANGYTDAKVNITDQKDASKIARMSVTYKTGDKKIDSSLKLDGESFVEITNQGEKRYENKPIEEPKAIIKTDNYVGDSTKLYGDDIDEEMGTDERGKPVRKSFMETHGKRIAQIMWEIANQKPDPHVRLSQEEQAKLEANLRRYK